jgi:rod shape-determining protein MreD
MSHLFFYVIPFIVCLLLQGLGHFLLSFWSPNFLLLLVIYLSFLKGPLVGVFNGFFIGFFADIFSLNPFGTQSFLFTVVAYVTGRLRGYLSENNPYVQVIVTFIVSLIYLLLYLLLMQLFPQIVKKQISGGDFLFLIGTTVSAIFFFRIMDEWNKLWQKIVYK